LHEKFAPANQTELIWLAYQESYTVVSFLIERYGLWYIQNALTRIKNKEEIGNILKSVFGLNWDTLQKKWLEYVKMINVT
jgi:hypothetical protein